MLTKYHKKMGHTVTVIASLYTFNENGKESYLSGPSEYDDANGVHVIRLAYKRPVKVFSILRRFKGLRESIERVQPDIIFSHNVSYSDTTVVVDYLRCHPHVKLYADNHADYINSARNCLSRNILHPIIWRHYSKKLEPYLIRCYGVTPMRCRFLKEMYHIKAGLVEFLPMGVDDEAIPDNRIVIRTNIRKKLGLTEDDFLVVTGGKIDRLKNTHVLIKAMDILNVEHLHLIICGTLTPEMDYLKTILDSKPHIHYLGWCSAEEVMNYMVAADLACFPGTHSTLWEQSVGIGVPAIFKRWPEMEHVYVNGNCRFVKGENANELADAIGELINTNKYKEMLSLAQIASTNFRYSVIAKRAIGL